MSKRNRTPAPGTGGRARSAPVKVSKPFPWGTVAVSVVLGALLLGIVAYAVANQGSGARNPLAEGDRIEGVQVTDTEDITAEHVSGPVQYEQMPPNNGNHAPPPLWQDCKVYTEEIAPEHAVHSLEHGAVWITYRPDDVSGEALETLVDKVDGRDYRLLSPLAGQDSPIVVTAWGRTLEVDSADDERIDQFLDIFTNGPQTPERGAACQGGVSTPGLQTTGA